jgi:hypothetical protein
MLAPKRANALNDNVEPKLRKSKTDREEPNVAAPNKEIDAPSRENVRSDKEEPM